MTKIWKRDFLSQKEQEVQTYWKNNGIYESKHVTDTPDKFFSTFPYPYMNGHLHLGHGFTMTKYDFISKYYRLNGYNILQPFSFHLTGMPIVSAAQKLQKCIAENNTKAGTQYDIMKKLDIPEQDIPLFTDPTYWGSYFIPKAIDTLYRFGITYDESKSFYTTDMNPYYSRFIKWQFDTLKHKGVLKFGSRYTIYSPKNKQSCLAHDRSEGEDAKPAKFSLIKLKLVDSDMFVIALTMRPETLYGITNVWIDPNFEYSIYSVNNEQWILQDYNVYNLIHQKYATTAVKLNTITGSELVGKTVTFPYSLSTNPIKILSLNYKSHGKLLQIDTRKGTGIVASVPSDSPIDYVGYLQSNMCDNIIPIIEVDRHDTYVGNLVGVDTVTTFGEFKDNKLIITEDNLQKAKEICYTKTTQYSSMLVGKYKGMSIIDAREKIEKDWDDVLIPYYEPDDYAVSRDGERLVVALEDQWFIDYSDPKWKHDTMLHIDQMELYDESVKHALIKTVEWITDWPFARTYGLGSKIDLDGKDFLVDSLSDSTIYMALYTIYDKLKTIDVDKLTNEVFDYIFLLKGDDEDYTQYKELQHSFMYWYPIDLRVSAKDLLSNHLTMCIMNHLIIWDDEFKNRALLKDYKISTFGPRRYKINGYITVLEPGKKEAEKMAKSTGNFKTLDQALDIYTADAIRMALADSGDTMDDAVFNVEKATKSVEKLYKELEWFNAVLQKIDDYGYRTGDITYVDNVFINEIRYLVSKSKQEYEAMRFRSAFHYSFDMMLLIRDWYRDITQNDMHISLIREYVVIQISVIYPVVPHFSYMIFNNPLFKENMCLLKELSFNFKDYITDYPYDPVMRWEHNYLKQVSKHISQTVNNKKNKKTTDLQNKDKDHVDIYVVNTVTPIEQKVIDLFSYKSDMTKEDVITHIKDADKKTMGRILQLYKHYQNRDEEYGPALFKAIVNKTLNEKDILVTKLEYYVKNITDNNMSIDIKQHTADAVHIDLDNLTIGTPIIVYQGVN